MIDPHAEIEELVAFRGRGPGTDAERRAAQHLRARLEELDRDVEVEPTWIWPNWPLAHTMYAVVGIMASIVATAVPLAGAIAAGVALAAAVTDLGGRIRLGRPLPTARPPRRGPPPLRPRAPPRAPPKKWPPRGEGGVAGKVFFCRPRRPPPRGFR